MPCSTTCFLEVGAHVSLKVATVVWHCFSKAKTEECNQKTRRFSDKSRMLLPGLDT